MRMSRSVLSLTTAVVLFTHPGTVRAQDPVENLTTTLATVYLKTMDDAIPRLLEAQALIQEARGFKDEATKLRAAAADVKAGAAKPNKEAGERAFSLAGPGPDNVAALKADSAKEMTQDQRQMLVAGIVAYLMGTKATVEVVGMLPNLASAVAGLSGIRNPLQLRSIAAPLATAKVLTSGLPPLVKSNVEAAKALKEYVVANKLPVDLSAFGDIQ